MNPHRLLCCAAGLLVALGAGAAVARAAGSPVGSWKAENGRTYVWKALPGGFAEYLMTAHKTATNHCQVKANSLVYKYHAVGNGLYRVDALIWNSKCAVHWEAGDETIKIVVTPTKMTHSCDKKYTEICFTYTRAAADTVPPVVEALVSSGTVGDITSLHYTVSDNSGKTWEEVALYRGSIVGRWKTTLGPALKGHVYAYKLEGTPASMKGKLTFCVTSHDAAGNKSKESCAAVTIK